ncbi:MAG TPA: xylulokinase [Gammaproteobacteria bacterium]|nr:xylulokinase [Gammaproteobacteria bacterium]
MYLGIDLGTSAVKTVLMDETQNIKAQASCSLPITQPQPLWSEQNPHDWWLATCDTIKTLQINHADLLAQVKAIGLSGQMHGATLLDQHNQVLRPAILWNDGRSAKQCQILAERVPQYQTITGNLIMAGFTAPKLLWVAEHEPEVFSQVAKVLLPKDYLRLLMTGVYATDPSDASGTAWLNVGQRRWSEEMLQATGLKLTHMPELFEGCDATAQVTPELAVEWGIPPETIVAGGAGDNAAAAVSMNVIAPGSAFLSLGTSGVYFVASKDYRTNPTAGVHTFCHCLPKLWHQMTVHLSAASCLSWLSSVVGASPFELLEEAETTPPSHDTIIFLPYLSGERTPHNDPYARGVFFGLSHTTQRSDLTRAVLEGVAFAFADGQDAMLAAQLPIQEVAVVGGGARSIYWGRILATVLNRPLVYREDREAGAALGAARLGWLAVHSINPENAFSTPPIENTVAPEQNLLETYAKKRAIFQQLYGQLRGVFAEAL